MTEETLDTDLLEESTIDLLQIWGNPCSMSRRPSALTYSKSKVNVLQIWGQSHAQCSKGPLSLDKLMQPPMVDVL